MEGTEDHHEARSTPPRRGSAAAPVHRTWPHALGDSAIAALVATVALIAFAMLGAYVARGETSAIDNGVRVFVLAHRPPLLGTVLRLITIAGSVTPMVLCAVVTALLLAARGRLRAAAALLVAPAGAVVAYLALKNVFERTRPSGIGNIIEGTYSFPSAHATTSAAVCCTLAYICWRERILRGPAALALCTVTPALIGGSRVVLDVHWATDVLGGWLAGLCIAALAAVLYLLSRRAEAERTLNEVSS